MPQDQSANPPIHRHRHKPTDQLAVDDPPVGLSEIVVRSHISPFAEYIRTNPAPFDLLTYFHRMGRLLVDALAVGYSHRQIFDFLAQQQPYPLPVRYRWFTHCLNIFRQQKGLPPVRAPRARRQLPATAINTPGALPSSLPAATTRYSSAPSPAISTATPHAPAPLLSAALSPTPSAVTIAPNNEDLSFEELETRQIEARLAKRFRPFTAEDAKHGKPIAEAIADKQRADLEAYEQALREGTATDW